jgi:cation diffusion facilitator CzcD-associated flavoprotein CzcO
MSDTVRDATDVICVVGAGSSGLAAAKNLREHGFAVEAFEREDDVGGNWNARAEHSRVYSSTHLISSKPFTQYPDFPMPDAFPDYPHHSHMHAYFRAYMRHFGLDEVIRFSTEVVRIAPAGQGRWDVTVRPRGGGAEETARYGGVVIANGHNWYPKMPQYPGSFDGEVLHSADYKEPSVLRGKRVLVVGAGNTGCDLAVEAAQNAEHCFHSTRRGYWYAQKYLLGKPADQVYDLMLSLRLPKRVLQSLLERTIRTVTGDVTRIGMKAPDHRMLETHPIVNQQLTYYVGHGEITPVDDIARFDGEKVEFADGRREAIDLVVYCTGYLVRFPFIDHAHLNWVGERPHLYRNVFHPEHDTLFVCGLIQPDSGQFKIVHWQAVAIAKQLEALRDGAPSLEAFRAVRREHAGEALGGGVTYKDSTRHYFEINHYDYLRGLEADINLLERR